MRLTTPALALAGALALAAAAQASPPAAKHFRGEIKRLDSSARTLVVREAKAPKQELQFVLAADAEIHAGAKTETIADLKTGERVSLSYTQNGGMREVHRVDVTPPAAAKKS